MLQAMYVKKGAFVIKKNGHEQPDQNKTADTVADYAG